VTAWPVPKGCPTILTGRIKKRDTMKVKEYAEKIREFADRLEKIDVNPTALRVIVFFEDGNNASLIKDEANVNLFTVAGTMSYFANHSLDRLKAATKEQPA
jgi:CO dehydrogenase/acetyl-CoA synthase epsilon subunit